MTKKSAGILVYRKAGRIIECLLVHPGGPFWRNKDEGAWSVPKGELDGNEDALKAARREFEEETGVKITGAFISLGMARQKSGKQIYVWAVQGDLDEKLVRSNVFEMEWPPHSGRRQTFPEIDRAAWFALDEAKRRINPGQAGFIEKLSLL